MGHPAYRIAVNKSVDRYLFMDLIHFVEKNNLLNIKDAKYYSLGGPFLVDLKLVHSHYPFLELNSIEDDKNTFLRQEAHKFCKTINLFNKTSSDFINETEFSQPAIFWLDYTKLKREYLDDIATLAYKLPQGSIIKITFNVSRPSTPSAENPEDALLSFKSKYSDYLPAKEISFDQISDQNLYEQLAFEMVENAAAKLLKERKDSVNFDICDAVTYCDSCKMISITGVLLDKSACDTLKDKLLLEGFSPIQLQEINMPDLSVFERHRINQIMPTQNIDELFRVLGYPLEREEREPWTKSLEKLRLYSRFWHRYPDFVKTSL